MLPSVQRAHTVGWLRVELARVELSERELSDLREHDVVLLDALAFRSDRGESGTGLLVLHDGRRYHVDLELRSGSYFATIVGRCVEAESEAVAINLVVLPFDPRAAGFEAGSTFPLNAGPADPLVVTVHDDVMARGRFVEIEGHLGVVIETLLPP